MNSFSPLRVVADCRLQILGNEVLEVKRDILGHEVLVYQDQRGIGDYINLVLCATFPVAFR